MLMSITSSDNEAEAIADKLIQGRQQQQRSQGSAATTSAADLTEIGNFAGCLRYLAVGVFLVAKGLFKIESSYVSAE